MKRTAVLLFFILMFVSIFGFVSCGKERTAPSVYKSKEQLSMLGYQFGEEDFVKAVKEKKADIVKLFLDAGMDPNTAFELGKIRVPVIFYVIDTQDEILFQIFLHAKVDLKASVNGVSVLFRAAQKAQPQIISLIVGSGVAIDERSDNGMTPLMAAIDNENVGAAWVFIQSGANVNAADVYGITPLMRAVGKGNVDLVRELIKKGADVNAETKKGTKVSKFIGEREKEAMEVLLRDAGAKF